MIVEPNLKHIKFGHEHWNWFCTFKTLDTIWRYWASYMMNKCIGNVWIILRQVGASSHVLHVFRCKVGRRFMATMSERFSKNLPYVSLWLIHPNLFPLNWFQSLRFSYCNWHAYPINLRAINKYPIFVTYNWHNYHTSLPRRKCHTRTNLCCKNVENQV